MPAVGPAAATNPNETCPPPPSPSSAIVTSRSAGGPWHDRTNSGPWPAGYWVMARSDYRQMVSLPRVLVGTTAAGAEHEPRPRRPGADGAVAAGHSHDAEPERCGRGTAGRPASTQTFGRSVTHLVPRLTKRCRDA